MERGGDGERGAQGRGDGAGGAVAAGIAGGGAAGGGFSLVSFLGLVSCALS